MTFAKTSFSDCNLERAELEAVSGGADASPTRSFVDRFSSHLPDISLFALAPEGARGAFMSGVSGAAGWTGAALTSGSPPQRALLEAPFGAALGVAAWAATPQPETAVGRITQQAAIAAGTYGIRAAGPTLDALGGSSLANIGNAPMLVGTPVAATAGAGVGIVGELADKLYEGSGQYVTKGIELVQAASQFEPRAAMDALVQWGTGSLISGTGNLINSYFGAPSGEVSTLPSTINPELGEWGMLLPKESAATSSDDVNAGAAALAFSGDDYANWSSLNLDAGKTEPMLRAESDPLEPHVVTDAGDLGTPSIITSDASLVVDSSGAPDQVAFDVPPVDGVEVT